jgi:hypothetical protein
MGRTFTHPDVGTLGVKQGWAEPEDDPTRIKEQEWKQARSERQALR